MAKYKQANVTSAKKRPLVTKAPTVYDEQPGMTGKPTEHGYSIKYTPQFVAKKKKKP